MLMQWTIPVRRTCCLPHTACFPDFEKVLQSDQLIFCSYIDPVLQWRLRLCPDVTFACLQFSVQFAHVGNISKEILICFWTTSDISAVKSFLRASYVDFLEVQTLLVENEWGGPTCSPLIASCWCVKNRYSIYFHILPQLSEESAVKSSCF